MAANPQLVDAFQRAVQLFNTQDWVSLERLLHERVTMKRLDDPVEYHKGKAAVMDYFHTKGNAEKANVTPKSQDNLVVGDIGLVWGSADWHNTKGAKAVLIAYAFAFKNVGGNWLALNLWGAYA
jgi:hypothetical protein